MVVLLFLVVAWFCCCGCVVLVLSFNSVGICYSGGGVVLFAGLVVCV